MDLGLKKKRALVTGSSRGTGAVTARTLAREGVHVVVHGNVEGDQSAIAADIVADGGQAVAVFGDVATDDGAAEVARQVAEATGGIDILVNNLGQAAGGTWSDATLSDWNSAYETNTLSAVRMIRAFVDGMKERGWGRIIQIATIGVFRPNSRMPHYYAAKGAMANLTVSLAKELASTGVTVNTVSPGLIRTAELEQYFRYRAKKKGWGEDWDAIEAAGVKELLPNPLGRMARMEEVADVVAFVASERASYLNGINVRVDGGATELVV